MSFTRRQYKCIHISCKFIHINSWGLMGGSSQQCLVVLVQVESPGVSPSRATEALGSILALKCSTIAALFVQLSNKIIIGREEQSSPACCRTLETLLVSDCSSDSESFSLSHVG